MALFDEVGVQQAERINETWRSRQAQWIGSEVHPAKMVGHFWRHRDLIKQLIAQEINTRYRGTMLGVLWSLLTPLLLLAIYTVVFAKILHVKWGVQDQVLGTDHFALTLFAGLIPFSVFSEVVSRATQAIVSVPHYVKKVIFPLEVLPLVLVGAAAVHSLISVGILLAGTVVLLGFVSPTLVFLPLVYIPLIFLSLGLGWFLTSLGVYLRDIGQVIGLAIQALFFVSPIFYPVSAVPASLQFFMGLNPLTVIITSFRFTILHQEGVSWDLFALWTAGSMLIAWLGYVWFMKTKRGFADVM